ncbi:siderophore-interacting protein, partial [Actinoalloteichus caeruleus]|uniref:siderophore-interacting protein n=2 Tax=Actinoalloteichus cyanogriseus TaxID=2893586 RepID=UPI001B807DD8
EPMTAPNATVAPRPTTARPTSTVCHATVTAARLVTPNMMRVTFGGGPIATVGSGGYDQRVKILLPLDGEDRPQLPAGDDWYQAWRAMPEALQPPMRTYTIREHRPELAEIDIDFALHGDAGPATRWANRVRPGAVLGLVAPAAHHQGESVGVEYRPGAADWQLLVGDATALPAIGAIVESLPPDAVAHVLVSVPAEDDAQPLVAGPGVEIRWLAEETGVEPGDRLVAELAGLDLPAGTPYAWVAGEAGLVAALRRHLLGDLGWDRRSHYFGGYWRH